LNLNLVSYTLEKSKGNAIYIQGIWRKFEKLIYATEKG